MIRLSLSETILSDSESDLEYLRRQFEAQHYVRITGFLEPPLLRLIQARLARGEFYERVHSTIGPNKELCLKRDFTDTILHILLNRPKLFQVVQSVTGVDQIKCFIGRVYRVIPGHGHHDAWHNDLVSARLIAMTINLSTEAYSGGLLQLRDCESGKPVNEIANVGPGDAILFRLAANLEHRITEVEGTTAKTAFAGWFHSEPHFLSLLKEHQQSAAVSDPTTEVPGVRS